MRVMTQDLTSEYNKKRHKIRKRLREFASVWKRSDKRIFSELCFCICTPQSKAIYCDRAIRSLERSGLLLKGPRSLIMSHLKGVRFPNNKATYLIAARKLFRNGGIKSKIHVDNILKTREWFVRNIKGLGYKEASHFLRNIGLGRSMAILDVHILRNLKELKIIKKIPSSVSRKAYLDIEGRMKEFSERIDIPLEELDLLFWSNQTGFIFK